MLQGSDNECSSSASSTENDSDSSYRLPNSNGQKVTIENQNKHTGNKRKNRGQKQTEKLNKKITNKVIDSTDKPIKESSSNLEKAIKTLEETILKLQERIICQDTAIESLSNKLNDSSVKDQPVTKQKDQSQKTIKKLEANIHLLFETNNHQQTCIDELIDKIEKHNKTEKWLRDKLTQLKGESSQKSKENDNSLQGIKEDLLEVASFNVHVTTEIKEMRCDIETLTKKFDLTQDENKANSHLASLKFKSLHVSAMQPVFDELRLYNKNFKNKIQTSVLSDHCYFRRNYEVNHHLIDEERKFWDTEPIPGNEIPISATVTISSREINTGMSAEIDLLEALTPELARQETEYVATYNENHPTCNLDIPSNVNMASNIQPGSDEAKVTNITSSDRYTGRPTESHFQCDSPNNRCTDQTGTETPYQTTRSSHPGNSQSTEADTSNQHRSRHSNMVPGSEMSVDNIETQSISETQSQPINSQRNVPQSSKDSIYRTRKCLLIHDPYLRTFQQEKFSKWLDVERLEVDSFSSLLKKGCLKSTISKVRPEAVFIHLGQGDVWNKLDPETVIGYAKQTIWKLLYDTGVKICLSLLIPVLGSPEQRDKIQAINEELSSFITELRKDKAYSNRIYSSNNSSLSGYIQYSTGPHGKKVDLTERGLAKCWLMMRDALRRTLGIEVTQRKRQRTTSAPRNETYDG